MSWYGMPNAWTAVEIHYQALPNGGSLTLWLEGVQKQSLNFQDNDTRTVTDVRLGAQGIETGTHGTIYFDDFESRRFSYIGMLPDPGIPDVEVTPQAGWRDTLYHYTGSQPHAVTSVSSDQSSVGSYQYDENGNMTCRTENDIHYRQEYNAENRIASIAKISADCTNPAAEILEVWAYVYDGDGTRVSTAHLTGLNAPPDSFTAYYMGGAYEVTDGAVKKYYSIAGMMVAMNDGAGLQYVLTDHLGSVVAITDANGTLTSQQRYLPFGQVREDVGSIGETDFGYTGQRNLDSDIGLMDYHARFYSSALGRFIQPDSIIPNPANPQSWNRYSYVLNNPINLNDPSGHIECEPGTECRPPGSTDSDNFGNNIFDDPGTADDDDPHHGHHENEDNEDNEETPLPVDIPTQGFVVGDYTFVTQNGSWPDHSYIYSYYFDGKEMDRWTMALYKQKYIVEELALFGIVNDLPGWLGISGDYMDTPSDQFTDTIRDFYYNTNRNGNFEVDIVTRLAEPTEYFGDLSSGYFGVELHEESTGYTQKIAIPELYFEFFGTLNNQLK